MREPLRIIHHGKSPGQRQWPLRQFDTRLTLRAGVGTQFYVRKKSMTWSPLKESNRRPSPYHGQTTRLCNRRTAFDQLERELRQARTGPARPSLARFCPTICPGPRSLVPFLSGGLCLMLRRQIYGGHRADPGGRFPAARESCARVALAAVAAINRARSAASPQVSHTAVCPSARDDRPGDRDKSQQSRKACARHAAANGAQGDRIGKPFLSARSGRRGGGMT